MASCGRTPRKHRARHGGGDARCCRTDRAPALLGRPAPRAADWGLTRELRMFLLDARRWNNDFDLNLRRWHGFLTIAAREATGTQFRRWVFRVVDAMVLALPGNDPE